MTVPKSKAEKWVLLSYKKQLCLGFKYSWYLFYLLLYVIVFGNLFLATYQLYMDILRNMERHDSELCVQLWSYFYYKLGSASGCTLLELGGLLLLENEDGLPIDAKSVFCLRCTWNMPFQDRITMEYVDHGGEINERVIDSKNIPFFRVVNSSTNQVWVWKILSPFHLKEATGTSRWNVCISQCWGTEKHFQLIAYVLIPFTIFDKKFNL